LDADLKTDFPLLWLLPLWGGCCLFRGRLLLPLEEGRSQYVEGMVADEHQ